MGLLRLRLRIFSMETKYMLMKGSEGPFTVPLLAKNNKLAVTVGGNKVDLTASIERWFIYHLYVGEGKGIVIRWFREVQHVSCLPYEYDAFISMFIKQHPKTTVEDYSLDIIPMQSDGKNGLSLPIPYYECTISEDAERELMDLFIKCKKKYQAKVRLSRWLEQYCQDYGYYFPDCEGQEYDYLYHAFLEQHGISPFVIQELEDSENVKPATETDKREECLGIIFRTILLIAIWAGLMCLGWYMLDKSDDFYLVTLGGLMFFILLGMLLAMFIPLYPDMTAGVWDFVITFIKGAGSKGKK